MINIYSPTEKLFKGNGYGTLDTEIENPIVKGELNAEYKLSFLYPADGKYAQYLVKRARIKCPIPGNEEDYFFITTVENDNGYLYVEAHHISHILAYDYIEDKNYVNKTPQYILGDILQGTDFTGTSDLNVSKNIRVVRQNKIEFMFDEHKDNTIVNRYGGEWRRRKFNIDLLKTVGRKYNDTGLEIRYGKNLVGYKTEFDFKGDVDRVFPLGFNALRLPEIYVQRPGSQGTLTALVEYPNIRAIEDPENPKEGELPIEEAKQALRDAVLADFANGVYDTKFSANVDFQMIYGVQKEYIYLGDEVRIIKEADKIDLIARVIAYEFNPLILEYINLELGNYKPQFTNINNRVKELEEKVVLYDTYTQQVISHVTDLMTSALGGYVIKRNGEILIMDTEDPLTATKVWRWNLNGLAYSGTGINGPYETAMTMDGHIVGKFITANSITAQQLRSDAGQNLELGSNSSIISTVTSAKEEAILSSKQYTDGVKTYIDGVFKDGVIDASEALYLKNYLNDLATAKADYDARFDKTYYNSSIGQVEKNNLYNAKNQLDIAYNQLVSTINTAISDGQITDLEKQDVDSKFSTYSNNINDFVKKLEEANNVILSTSITQNNDSILIQVDTKIQDLDLATKLNGKHLIDQSFQQDLNAIPLTESGEVTTSWDGSNLNWFAHDGYKIEYSRFIDYVAKLPYYYKFVINPQGWDSAIYYAQILFYDADKNEIGTNGSEINMVGAETIYGWSEKTFEGYIHIEDNDIRNTAKFIRVRLISRYQGSENSSSITYWKQIILKQLSLSYTQSGTVLINKDGVTSGNTNTPVQSSLEATGLYIRNGQTNLANFTDTGAYTPLLYADKVVSDNVVGKLGDGRDKTVNLYISNNATGDGTGRDLNNKSNSLKNALDNYFGQNGRWLDYVRLKINIDQGNYSEDVSLIGIGGHGFITFNLAQGTVWNGVWSFINVSPIIDFGPNKATLVKGSQQDDQFVVMAMNSYVSIGLKNLNGSDKSTCRALALATHRGFIDMRECDGINGIAMVRAEYGGECYMINNKGNVDNALIVSAGKGYVFGTVPKCTDLPTYINTGFIDDRKTTQVPTSNYQQNNKWTTNSKTFTAELNSVGYNGAYNYPGLWVMGAYQQYYYKGTASFGNQIKAWLDSNGGYNFVESIIIKVTRNGSGYGTVSPQISSPASQTLNPVAVSGTSETNVYGTTLGNIIISSSNLNLESVVSFSKSLYMKATKIEITVTCQKRI